MSTVIKRVSNALPSPYRNQNFTEADASAGDLIDVKTSLGRPASNCKIEVDSTGDGMAIRFNVKRTVYPKIPRREGHMYFSHLPYLISGEDYTDSTVARVNIESGTTYELSNGPAISDIEILTASGHFDIWVS